MKAIWNGAVLAQSDDTVVVDGNHYFPAEALDAAYFEDSGTHTICSWKGEASYKTVVVGGERNEDAAWQNGTHGTSPIVAGGLLFVYDMDSGGIAVYHPASGRLITTLACPGGHWNSPIAVDGHLIEPTGDANDHAASGQLEIWSVR